MLQIIRSKSLAGNVMFSYWDLMALIESNAEQESAKTPSRMRQYANRFWVPYPSCSSVLRPSQYSRWLTSLQRDTNVALQYLSWNVHGGARIIAHKNKVTLPRYRNLCYHTFSPPLYHLPRTRSTGDSTRRSCPSFSVFGEWVCKLTSHKSTPCLI